MSVANQNPCIKTIYFKKPFLNFKKKRTEALQLEQII